jgi:hypothetical protein
MSLAPAARPAPAKATVRVRESRHRGCRKNQYRSASSVDAAVLERTTADCGSDNFTGRAIISFRTQPGPSLLRGGVGLQATNITRHNDGTNAFRELDASIIRETNGASPAERDRLAEGELT